MFDRRLGRLQRQSWAAFIAADGGEVSSDAIAEWCWPEAADICSLRGFRILTDTVEKGF
jgi:hypothetical protein